VMVSKDKPDLPRGWSFAKIGDILTLEYGKGLTKETRDKEGNVPVFGSNGIVGYHSVPLVSEPCLIVGRKGAVGCVHLSQGPCWPIDTTYYIIPPQGIDIKFLFYCLNIQNLKSLDKSTAIPGLNRDDAYSLPIFLPPLPEQYRIVAKIEELFSDLDAGVEALKKAKAQLKLYRTAVLKAAVEGALTAEWCQKHPHTEPASELLKGILIERRHRWEQEQLRQFKEKGKEPPKNWKAKYKEPVAPNTADLPPLPDGWCWSSLGQCFEVHVGATPSRKVNHYWGGNIPWVASGEVQFCNISDTREKITEEGLANSSTNLNPPGSVILNMIGEGKTRGKAGILEIAACNNQNCAAIWVSLTAIKPRFIFYWLCFQYEKTRQLGSGNNQPAMNKSIVESIPFPLPPIHEQEDILEIIEDQLSMIDHLNPELGAMLQSAQALGQAILQKAFAGRLAPQDPEDEPASLLLERIKREKAGIAAGKKPGRRPAQRNLNYGQ
jgi:type I restriction enzyme S subunit